MGDTSAPDPGVAALEALDQVTVDGLNGNELSGTNRMNSSINLDAIAEVKVLLNTYKAEFGHSGGANIQVVSKSGGSDYRGSAYYYGRRDAWNATPWENARAGIAKPKYHIDTPGFNLGGPVRIRLVGSVNERSCSSSTPSRRAGQPGPLICAACRPRSSGREFLADLRRERPADLHQGSLSTAACARPPAAPGFAGNIIPSNRLVRTAGADRHDAAAERARQSRTTTTRPGDRPEPALQQSG
jgi:hypothetical protein